MRIKERWLELNMICYCSKLHVYENFFICSVRKEKIIIMKIKHNCLGITDKMIPVLSLTALNINKVKHSYRLGQTILNH